MFLSASRQLGRIQHVCSESKKINPKKKKNSWWNMAANVGMMLFATLSLVEKVAHKIRHKHVSALRVIIAGKTSARRNESPLGWLAC